MKKIILKTILVCCLLIALIYISCENKNDISNQQVEEMTTPALTQGIAHFATAKELYATLDKTSSLTFNERTKWESEMGFVSQFTLINEALSEIGEADTDEEIDLILQKNRDLIKLSDDNEIIPAVPSATSSFVVNREGYFYVNNYLHKVTQEGVLVSKTPGKTTINEISDEIIVFKTSSNDTKNCGPVQNSEPLIEGNRKVRISIVTEKVPSSDGYLHYYHDYVSCIVLGYKKVFGSWVGYNSIYWHQNLRCTVVTMVSSLYGKKGTNEVNEMPVYEAISYSWPSAESPYEAHSYTWTYPVGETFEFTYEPELTAPFFTQVGGEGKSRGTTGWAIVTCGY